MSSTAITAQGIAIARFGTTAFETIPNVVSFQGPGGQAAVIDVTNLASTAKEKRVGLRDEGQLSLTLHYNPDDLVHQGLRTDRANRVRRQFKITFTDTNRCHLDLLRLCHALQRARRRGRGGAGLRDHRNRWRHHRSLKRDIPMLTREQILQQ